MKHALVNNACVDLFVLIFIMFIKIHLKKILSSVLFINLSHDFILLTLTYLKEF